MVEKGLLNRDIFKFSALNEWQFVISDRPVVVRFSLDRMREDIIKEGIDRGLDESALRELAGVFTFREAEKNDRHKFSAASYVVLAAPLRKSKFIIEYSLSSIGMLVNYLGFPHPNYGKFSFIKPFKNVNRISESKNPDTLAQNVREHLETLWRHEREHLLQWFTKSPDEREAIIRSNMSKELSTAGLIMLISVLIGFALPITIDTIKNGHFDLKLLLATPIFSFLINSSLSSASKLINYKNRILEREAFLQGMNGKNLPHIFDIEVVN